MNSAARAHADNAASAAAITLPLSRAAGELERLRASLDAKLATLEAALAGPDECDSLETLVIDLARVATREADAAATRACLDAQVAAEEQVSRARVEAERSIQADRAAAQAERAAAETLRAQLDTARATLEAERASAATLERKAGELHTALETERESARTLRLAVQEAEQRIFAVKAVKERELAELRDQLEIERTSGRAGAARLEQNLEALRLELRAAKDASDTQRVDLEASQQRLHAAEQHVTEIDRARAEADVRAEAARRETAALAEELRGAREAAEQRMAAMDAVQARLDAMERDAAEQERRHREAVETLADTARRERAVLAAELETAHQTSRDASALRAQLEAADAERASMESALKDTERSLETAVRARDSINGELEAARAAVDTAEARYQDLRESTAERIRDLELALEEVRQDRAASTIGDTGGEEVEDDLGAELWADEADDRCDIDIDAVRASADPPSLIPPTRRTERHRLSDEVEVQVDELPAILVDLSVNGAQILSLTALKPNRAVELQLPVGGHVVLCRGKVVWARLEASSDAIRYRGGVFFTHVDPRAIEAFITGGPFQPKSGQSLSVEPDTERHPASTPAAFPAG